MFVHVLTLSFYNNFCDAAELTGVPIKTHAIQFIFLQFLQLSTMPEKENKGGIICLLSLWCLT